jgi:PHD/YefM family antitoxin component YafN of YafNO toxin-antitoxin module
MEFFAILLPASLFFFLKWKLTDHERKYILNRYHEALKEKARVQKKYEKEQRKSLKKDI